MAEEIKKEEKVVVREYTVKHYEDGSVDAVPAEVDGKPSMKQEDVFEDIEQVATVVKENKMQQICYKAAYYGTMQALTDFFRAQAAAREAAPEEPKVEE